MGGGCVVDGGENRIMDFVTPDTKTGWGREARSPASYAGYRKGSDSGFFAVHGLRPSKRLDGCCINASGVLGVCWVGVTHRRRGGCAA